MISCQIIGRTPRGLYSATNETISPVCGLRLGAEELVSRRRCAVLSNAGRTHFAIPEMPVHKWAAQASGLGLVNSCLDLPGFGLEFVSEPLVICHFEESRGAEWAQIDGSLNWVNKIQSYLAPETYAAFLLTNLGHSASKQGDWSAFAPLLVSAFRKEAREHSSGYVLWYMADSDELQAIYRWHAPRKYKKKSPAWLNSQG